ncbi:MULTISPECIES: hypothetical protein [Mannheimia]|nr:MULTISPECIES: hypothetical protein [Mannheimia]
MTPLIEKTAGDPAVCEKTSAYYGYGRLSAYFTEDGEKCNVN